VSPRRRSKKRSGRNRQSQQPIEFWKAVPDLGPIEPVVPARDPSAVVRSLGSPPLTGQGATADRHLVLVIDKAAKLATALAAAEGLLDTSTEDDLDTT
jgi:hypothetical protein